MSSEIAFWRGRDETTNHSVADLDPDLNHIFALLSNPRRRALLYLLQDIDEDPLWTTNLAVQLARIETDKGEDPHDAAEEIALTLRHNHLPKLANAGLIDADSTMTTFSYEGTDRLEDLLQWSQHREDAGSWLHTE